MTLRTPRFLLLALPVVLALSGFGGCDVDEDGSQDAHDAPSGDSGDVGGDETGADTDDASESDLDEHDAGDAPGDLGDQDAGVDAPGDIDGTDASSDTAHDADAAVDAPHDADDVTHDAPDATDAAHDATDVGDVPDGLDAPGDVSVDIVDVALDSDADVIEPPACTGALPRFAGTFCSGGCAVAVDEWIEPTTGFRNGAPAIALDDACEPHVLYSLAMSGFHGHYASRSGGTWSVESTPFDVARGSLAFDGEGAIVAFVSNGGFGLSGHVREPGGSSAWSALPAVGFDGQTLSGNLARDPSGRVVALAKDRTDQLRVLTLVRPTPTTFAWTDLETGAAAGANSFRLALGPAGEPHLFWWAAPGSSGWQLFWRVGGGLSRNSVVYTLGSSSLGFEPQAFSPAVTAATAGNSVGTPHVFVSGNPDGCGLSMEILTRDSTGAWGAANVPALLPLSCTRCDTPPTSAGETCAYDYVQFVPIGLVASDADQGALYTRRHLTGSLTSDCAGPGCRWEPDSSANTSDLYFARPGGRPVRLVEGDAWMQSARLEVDGLGRIHVAAYDTRDESGFAVRYLRIDPAD